MKRLLSALFSISILQPTLAMKAPNQSQKTTVNKSGVDVKAFMNAIIECDSRTVRKYIEAKGDVNVVFSNGLNAIQLLERLPGDEFGLELIYSILRQAGAAHPKKALVKPKSQVDDFYDVDIAWADMSEADWADLEDAACAEGHLGDD